MHSASVYAREIRCLRKFGAIWERWNFQRLNFVGWTSFRSFFLPYSNDFFGCRQVRNPSAVKQYTMQSKQNLLETFNRDDCLRFQPFLNSSPVEVRCRLQSMCVLRFTVREKGVFEFVLWCAVTHNKGGRGKVQQALALPKGCAWSRFIKAYFPPPTIYRCTAALQYTTIIHPREPTKQYKPKMEYGYSIIHLDTPFP